MLVSRDFNLLDVYKGLVDSKSARVFYVDSIGNKERDKSFSEHEYNEEAKLIIFDYMGKEESCTLYTNQEVLTENGWKNFKDISENERVIAFDSLTTSYGGTELLLVPCNVKSVATFSEGKPLNLKLNMCIINRLNIREAL